MQWWDTAYRFRRKLIIEAGNARPLNAPFTGLVPIDISTLGNMLVSRDDVRICRFVAGAWQELNRVIYDDVHLYFPIEDDIAQYSYTDNYYIYYDNPDAVTPPADRRYVLVPRLDSQTNSLYYLDGNGNDYAEGQLTPDTDLTPAGVSFPDFFIYKGAYGDGNFEHALYRASESPRDSWGSADHPLRNFEFWALPLGGGTGRILSFWRAGGPNSWQKISVIQSGSELVIRYGRVDNSDIYDIHLPGVLSLGELHHYAGAWFSNNTFRLWKDGNETANVAAPGYPRGEAQNAYPSLFAEFNGDNMESFFYGLLYGVRFGRDNGDEMMSRYSNVPFRWGVRSTLPTVSVLGVEGLSGHMGAV